MEAADLDPLSAKLLEYLGDLRSFAALVENAKTLELAQDHGRVVRKSIDRIVEALEEIGNP